MPTYDAIYRGGRLARADGEAGLADLGVRDGKVARVGDLSGADAGEVIDCTGLTLLPGAIDSQVHFREPGMTHKEDLETGSRGAVLGGVTSVFEMPNTNPLTTTPEALADKLARAKGRMHCDHAFWVGGTHENAGDVPELERLPGAAGIKVFMGSSTGALLVEDDAGVRAILSRTTRRAAFHSEDEARLRERAHLRVPGDPASHPVWRDVETAHLCTRRLLSLARETGAKIHVLHVSTGEEMATLAAFRAAHPGLASVEVTPHHLTLEAPDAYDRLGTLAQMNPPVRGHAHRMALWAALERGVVDVIGSDHAPHTREEKARPYPASPSGMTGVQTLLPLMLDHVAAGRLTLPHLVRLTSLNPARLFGIEGKGRLEPGFDADISVVDLARRAAITDEATASRSGWTPHHGREVTGWPVGTVVRGVRVMWEGEVLAPGRGEPVRFAHRAVTASPRLAC